MKKKYIIPTLILVHVQAETIIALSRLEGEAVNGDDNGVTMGTKGQDDYDLWDE